MGRRGEARAVRHLRRAGLRIEARNVRFPGGEIDIVAREGHVLVFVEVKTRRGDAVAPVRSVTAAKRRRILGLAERYLRRFPGEPPPCRFDVVEVVLPRRGRPAVRHLVDAFRGD